MPPDRPSPSPTVRMRLAVAMLCALGVAGCSRGRENLDQPPNARGIIIANRALLWRNLDSIRNASIAQPQRQGDVWRVCIRMSIKGPIGTKPGERDYLVGLYGVAKPPELLPEDAAATCAGQPRVPFPELEGGYQTDEIKPRGKGAK